MILLGAARLQRDLAIQVADIIAAIEAMGKSCYMVLAAAEVFGAIQAVASPPTLLAVPYSEASRHSTTKLATSSRSRQKPVNRLLIVRYSAFTRLLAAITN
jgi:hypothetical protein